MIYGLGAYLLWGLFPAFFPLLEPASPVEIIAHRLVWSAVIMAAVITARRGWSEVRAIGARTWAWLAVSGLLISGNWLLYVVAVNSGHVAEAALGYFINPLVAVLLGVLVLREGLRRPQALAIGCAAVAVLWLTISVGRAPFLGLGLAFSFGFYGLVKKRVAVGAITGLAVETMLVAPLALGYLTWLHTRGEGTFGAAGLGNAALLVASGLVTVVPLLLFNLGARALSLTTVGMLQYITPTMQLLWALFVTHEPQTWQRWVGFLIIWVAVALYLSDLLRHRRRARAGRAAAN